MTGASWRYHRERRHPCRRVRGDVLSAGTPPKPQRAGRDAGAPGGTAKLRPARLVARQNSSAAAAPLINTPLQRGGRAWRWLIQPLQRFFAPQARLNTSETAEAVAPIPAPSCHPAGAHRRQIKICAKTSSPLLQPEGLTESSRWSFGGKRGERPPETVALLSCTPEGCQKTNQCSKPRVPLAAGSRQLQPGLLPRRRLDANSRGVGRVGCREKNAVGRAILVDAQR